METALLLLAGANWGVTRSTVRVSKHKGVSIVNRGCRPSSITPFIHNKLTSEEGMIVNWRQHEPTLEDILSDSIIKAVMKADGVDPHHLAAMLKELGRKWGGVTPEFDVLADIAYRLNKQGADQPTTPGVRSMVAEAALAM